MGYIVRDDLGNYLGVNIYYGGFGYTISENIIIQHSFTQHDDIVINNNTTNFKAKVDGIGQANVVYGGSNYSKDYPPNVVVNSDSGSNAELSIDVIGSSVSKINVINSGSGYISATVSIEPPSAILKAILRMGVNFVSVGGIQKIKVLNGGSGYKDYNTVVNIDLPDDYTYGIQAEAKAIINKDIPIQSMGTINFEYQSNFEEIIMFDELKK